ncbi:MAG: hypothetical protein H0U97_18030 [Gammaproteobacteria bacterium]|nr:hypothetical protein [Gammaproteobacteria bacterium]
MDSFARSALGDMTRSALTEFGQKVLGAFFQYDATTGIRHGTLSTIKLDEGGEEVFATDGVTRLGATLRLSGFRGYDRFDPLPREARTFITKSEYGRIQSALTLGPSATSVPNVVAIGESLVPAYQQIGAQLFGGRTSLLRYLSGTLQPAVAAIDPDDAERIYEGTDMEYQVSIRPERIA